jgi:hypothetical protein
VQSRWLGDYQLAVASDHGTTKSRDKEKRGSIKKVFEITSIVCTPGPRDWKMMVALVATFGRCQGRCFLLLTSRCVSDTR